jgi:fibro-slime domain-containing protein
MTGPRRLTLLAVVASLGCARVASEGGTGGSGAGATDSGAGASSGGAFDAARPDRISSGVFDALSAGGLDGLAACQRELRAVVRDFRSGEKDGQPKHPDFEAKVAADPGIVASRLGADLKPVYAGGTTGTTTTKENFDQWYRDVDGINIRFDKVIPLTPDPARPGFFVFDSDAFYPLANDEGWGNQYLDHNQDFTTELHVSFPYKGGEVFTFRGDDDVFLFVNDRLVVDLGGVHDPLTGTVAMDQWATELGLQVGQIYQMHIFHAERHCCNSRFHLETTLSCIVNIEIQ